VPASSNTLATATVTGLVSQWISSGNNKGIFLQKSGGSNPYFHGRLASNSSYRPVLQVVTSNGTVNCPCTSSCQTSLSTTAWQDGRTELVLGDPSQGNVLLQFNLGSVTGTVTSAILMLYTSRSTSGATVNVFEVDGRAYVLAGSGTPVGGGISAGLPYDVGIASNPNVIAVGDFSIPLATHDQTAMTVWNGSVATGQLNTQNYDSTLQTTRLKAVFGPSSGATPVNLQLDVYTPPGAQYRMTNSSAPDEMYSRYHIEFGTDWVPTQGCKLPGVHGRFGQWHPMPGTRAKGGYWDGEYTGNGGSRPTGLEDYVTDNYYPSGGYRYGGWSCRLWTNSANTGPTGYDPAYDNQVSIDANPYAAMVPYFTYTYHLDMGDYGDQWTFGRPQTADVYGNTWGPAVLLEKGKRYSVETYVKMNTVANADANGNGTANYDGIIRVWINDVLVFERTNMRFSHNDKIGVHGSWLDSFQGGGSYPQPPNMHFTIDSHVVATAKIGPRNEPHS